ncbi:DoxX family protein [Brevundimonas sp. 2R-24]|uniref:DoxX family protein n=1 Tax=Peiella sedimenti TaxID=3061083 RepID=A0ABT8SLI5_9CAUL|nr:DoxX family protein [Caulobacteraceae bacterium XZ-24]
MNWIDPVGFSRFQGLALLALRLFLGAFLIYGVWDNITDASRMAEFAQFLGSLNCPMPNLAAPVSVWAQFLIGVSLIAGLLTRWAGVLLAINFAVAFPLIQPTGASFRDLYPPMVLIFIGLVFAAFGSGPYAVDRLLGRR